jgi:hypothetical protein
MTHLRQRMIEDMQMRGLSEKAHPTELWVSREETGGTLWQVPV